MIQLFRPRLRVSQKIILPFLLVVVLGILTTIPYGIRLTDRLNLERSNQELLVTSRITGNYLNTELDELLTFAQITMHNGDIKQAVTARDKDLLVRYLLPSRAKLKLDLLTILDNSGRAIVDLGPRGLDDEFEARRILNRVETGMNLRSMEIGRQGIFMLVVVPNEKTGLETEGALVAGLMIDRDFMEELSSIICHPLALLSGERHLVASSDPALAEAVSGRRLPEDWGNTRYVDFRLGQEPHRAIVAPLEAYGAPKIELAAALPMGQIMGFRERLITYMLFLALGSAAIVVAMGLVLARKINTPIKRLLSLTGEVGRGNLEVRVDEAPGDELGELAHAFNIMVARLKENVDEIKNSRTKLALYAHEMEKYGLELQREKLEVETILQNMRDGIIMVDVNGNILAINPEASRIIGVDQASAVNRSFKEIIRGFQPLLADPGSFLEAVDFFRPEESGEKPIDINVNAARRLVLRLKSYPVFTTDRQLLGRILIMTNITREKELEEMKNNFLATISHELRTPLTSIKGSLNLLLDGNLGIITQEQREFIKIASHNSERLTALVNNLLDLARIEAGEFRARRINCDLSLLIKKALNDLKGMSAVRRVRLGFQAEAETAPIQADPEKIIQLISNLVDNAVKFSPDDGLITVALRPLILPRDTGGNPDLAPLPPGDYFAVEVVDQGPGIPFDHLERIFEKFHQADMTSTRRAGGSGLGLTIARTIVREHGGAIWAGNIPGGGSRFTFVLPRVPAQMGAPAPLA